MKFEARYFGERLTVLNPEGDVAVVTLWSKVESMLQIFKEAGIDLSESSRISVMGNLYGNGLPQMIRNLLWNPQISHLLIVGQNLSGSREWLTNFLERGLEPFEFLGQPSFRIIGTDRVIDSLVLPEHFSRIPETKSFEDICKSEGQASLRAFFAGLPTNVGCDFIRIEPPPLPEPSVTRFPSEPHSHTIVRDTPMEAWKELVFHLFRFGFRNIVAKKTGPETRIELLNTHVVVEHPVDEGLELIQSLGFDHNHFLDYQMRILDPLKPLDLKYSYGNRLRGYFLRDGEPVDCLTILGERLQNSPDSRHAFLSLWDTVQDTVSGTGCPCFDSAFFRRFDGKLSLTATFRTHNAMSAWPENLYGLMAIQKFVSEIAGIPSGPITVISRSISIDLSALEKAKQIVALKEGDEIRDAEGKMHPRMDPNGSFTITVDRDAGEIVAEHSYLGVKLEEYRGTSSAAVERQIARNCAVSLISHALYLGRELARAEMQLKSKSV